MARLTSILRSRGYLKSYLPTIQYDAPKRESLLLRLSQRDRHARKGDVTSTSRNTLIFKCQYGLYLKPLGLQKELNKLYRQLPLGDAFLQEQRTIIAHPVSKNLFLSAHRYNFVFPLKRGSG